MSEIDKRARIAGAIYLLASIPAFFSMMYVPGRVIVHADILATVDRALAAETLFRWGVAAELVSYAAWVLVPVALYHLFVEVDRGWARLMLILGLMTVPIVFVGDAAQLTAVSLLHDARLAAALPASELKALAGLGIRLHGQVFTAAEVFWGVWLFPFAVLVWRSGFLPRFLAVLLAIGGVGWLVASLTDVVAPEAAASLQPFTKLATSAGELPIIFWLLVAGARPRSASSAQAAAVAGG